MKGVQQLQLGQFCPKVEQKGLSQVSPVGCNRVGLMAQQHCCSVRMTLRSLSLSLSLEMAFEQMLLFPLHEQEEPVQWEAVSDASTLRLFCQCNAVRALLNELTSSC